MPLSLLLLLLLASFSLSFSDPRISEAGIYCGATKTTNLIPAFIKEMESLSQLITTHHFATYHLTNSSPTIYTLAQCHHDLSQTDCLLCYAASRTKLPRCLPSLSALIFLDGCFLRYDNYSFYNESVSTQLDTVTCSASNVSIVGENERLEFNKSVGFAVGNVSKIAVRDGGFGTVEVKGVYALAQCWESVDRDGCRECLDKADKAVRGCGPKREGRGMNAGCYLRYSTDKFYDNVGETEDNHGLSGLGVIMAMVLGTAAFLMLSLLAAYAVYRKFAEIKQGRNSLGLISTSLSRSGLSFKYETLEKATDYFSDSMMIGQGGAGTVFMGTLPNGQNVAVKRLVFNTRQWVDDFFNEVNLISGIQHKNLVKLLGCSIEGPESLLVYEYVPNKSLDQFIFDNKKTQVLNWKQRFNIIVGTAEGIEYLHGGTQIRIIHRDIKSSNVLLDEDLTPKIADFGLARCIGADKTHLSTGIAGTLGYMAPEYLVRGQLTEKVDVYSFGVLVLEIVCGRRSSSFVENSGSLLEIVWRLFKSNGLAEVVDRSLYDDFPIKEVLKVLQIGLLCTQAAVALRPSMDQVVLMLTCKDCDIPIPNQPPFLNASALEPASPSRSYSTNSFISNAARKLEVSYSSSESSSVHSSDWPLRSRDLMQK
ncbi:Pkinase domain-containing protein/Stress-antifung domain-containing protein [Cephalotus follicularis]|uniref:Pkinase domain-containing protein/Stress-antifung domain-containing protein n=1 Tax=Cephalotus follicularis TaxID=3775 RepID=A0A1Q3BJN5_CEPFO|nr:Pkinase domain-containing protein/Stress-antifung domain-containing protein [Cephalotus follicularis]